MVSNLIFLRDGRYTLTDKVKPDSDRTEGVRERESGREREGEKNSHPIAIYNLGMIYHCLISY